MTKKELARMEELLTAAALRSTSEVLPDVPMPSYGEPLAVGFWPVDTRGYDPRIEPACSSSVYHAVGRSDATDSQGPKRLFSSKLLALKALRFLVERQCATSLRRIDKMIQSEDVK